jgi:hypothetical protein
MTKETVDMLLDNNIETPDDLVKLPVDVVIEYDRRATALVSFFAVNGMSTTLSDALSHIVRRDVQNAKHLKANNKCFA